MATQRSEDINCILKLAQQKLQVTATTLQYICASRELSSQLSPTYATLHTRAAALPVCLRCVRSFTAISCAVFACSIAVTNPFYLSALTRKQMSKRLPTAEARDASRAQGSGAGPKDTGRC